MTGNSLGKDSAKGVGKWFVGKFWEGFKEALCKGLGNGSWKRLGKGLAKVKGPFALNDNDKLELTMPLSK